MFEQTSFRCATAIVAATLVCAAPAAAAPVFLQNYEGTTLTEPFHLQPHFSGTSQGEGTTSITLITDDSALPGTSQSAELVIPDDGAGAGGAGGWAGWQIRLLPNGSGGRTAANPGFAPDGYVGYYLRVDPSVTAEIQTAPVLEDPGTTTATVGFLQPIIRDGQWHLYQWNMDDPAQFPQAWRDVYDDGATLGDTMLSGDQSFDSIAIVTDSSADATIRIDQIGYDNAGPLPAAIPEPTSLALLGCALGLLARRRRGA